MSLRVHVRPKIRSDGLGPALTEGREEDILALFCHVGVAHKFCYRVINLLYLKNECSLGLILFQSDRSSMSLGGPVQHIHQSQDVSSSLDTLEALVSLCAVFDLSAYVHLSWPSPLLTAFDHVRSVGWTAIELAAGALAVVTIVWTLTGVDCFEFRKSS